MACWTKIAKNRDSLKDKQFINIDDVSEMIGLYTGSVDSLHPKKSKEIIEKIISHLNNSSNKKSIEKYLLHFGKRFNQVDNLNREHNQEIAILINLINMFIKDYGDSLVNELKNYDSQYFYKLIEILNRSSRTPC
ncbi:MAG: hypothetical protein AAF443_04735 [Chlamydiota bacterium]